MSCPGSLDISLEKRLRGIVTKDFRVTARAGLESLVSVVIVQALVRSPYIHTDKVGTVISLRYLGRPVQERCADTLVGIAPLDDDPPDIKGQLVTFIGRPDRFAGRGHGLFG